MAEKVEKGSKITNKKTIRERKIQGETRDCYVFKYRGKLKVNVVKDRRYNLTEQALEQIKHGKAKQLFEQRPKRSKVMDLKRSSRIMFVVPNRIWASAINKYDIWGIDSSREPPEYDSLPKNPLPFEVVKVKGRIYCADNKGNFRVAKRKGKLKKPEQIKDIPLQLIEDKLYKIKSTEYWVKKFKRETGKSAIHQGRITKGYTEWLRNEYRLENIAEDLNYKDPHNKLYLIKDYYEQLDLPEDELKKVMFKVYNKVMKKQIDSYTKDYNDFYNRRFYDIIERDLNALKKKQKEKMKDPLKKKRAREQYESNWGLRHGNIRRSLNSRQYTRISNFDIGDKLHANPKMKDLDIVEELIKEYEEGLLIDSDLEDIDEAKQQERKKWEEIEDYYTKKAYEDYVDQLASLSKKS